MATRPIYRPLLPNTDQDPGPTPPTSTSNPLEAFIKANQDAWNILWHGKPQPARLTPNGPTGPLPKLGKVRYGQLLSPPGADYQIGKYTDGSYFVLRNGQEIPIPASMAASFQNIPNSDPFNAPNYGGLTPQTSAPAPSQTLPTGADTGGTGGGAPPDDRAARDWLAIKPEADKWGITYDQLVPYLDPSDPGSRRTGGTLEGAFREKVKDEVWARAMEKAGLWTGIPERDQLMWDEHSIAQDHGGRDPLEGHPAAVQYIEAAAAELQNQGQQAAYDLYSAYTPS